MRAVDPNEARLDPADGVPPLQVTLDTSNDPSALTKAPTVLFVLHTNTPSEYYLINVCTFWTAVLAWFAVVLALFAVVFAVFAVVNAVEAFVFAVLAVVLAVLAVLKAVEAFELAVLANILAF